MQNVQNQLSFSLAFQICCVWVIINIWTHGQIWFLWAELRICGSVRGNNACSTYLTGLTTSVCLLSTVQSVFQGTLVTPAGLTRVCVCASLQLVMYIRLGLWVRDWRVYPASSAVHSLRDIASASGCNTMWVDTQRPIQKNTTAQQPEATRALLYVH